MCGIRFLLDFLSSHWAEHVSVKQNFNINFQWQPSLRQICFTNVHRFGRVDSPLNAVSITFYTPCTCSDKTLHRCFCDLSTIGHVCRTHGKFWDNCHENTRRRTKSSNRYVENVKRQNVQYFIQNLDLPDLLDISTSLKNDSVSSHWHLGSPLKIHRTGFTNSWSSFRAGNLIKNSLLS